MSDNRPNPDTLLALAKEDEDSQRGKLKIYLGAAPGVGKTYTMLEDALALREKGLDVVAGIVESHGRKEIDDLITKFEILPRHLVEYHNRSLLEFDLDAALSRMPAIILIDEMAHTNIPGLRHAKRWQDIKELLDRGIDVFTTLNVQHIESLNDEVSRMIGIHVHETVPDSMIESADTIEVVDLPPDDLLRRLQEGKVYVPAQAELATKNFFRKGNLTVLRELALRATADRVDEQALQHRRGQGIAKTWRLKERLLVCIGFTAGSTRVIRAARRMAGSLHAAWIVVHVETPQQTLTDEQRNMVVQNLRFAEQLGAETRILTGTDVVDVLMNFAHEKNVTKIVMGKHDRPRWRDLLFGSLVDELVRLSGDVDIYIIRGDSESKKSPKVPAKKKPVAWGVYQFGLLAYIGASIINFMLGDSTGGINILMVYLVSIVVVAMQGRLGPALMVSILSIVTYVYFFITPSDQFMISDVRYIFTLIASMGIASLVSYLAQINRKQAEIAHLNEDRTSAVYALTRQLASTRGLDKLLDISTSYLAAAFNSDVLAILPTENAQLQVMAASSRNRELTTKDQGVVQWVYDLGQVAGLGTDTLPFSDSVYVPLLGSQGTVGVLKVHPKVPEKILVPDQLRLLETCANQIALVLEVDRLQDTAKNTQLTIETERLRNALFSSLSHDLHDPLSSMVNLINNFINQKTSDSASYELVQNIAHEAESLNRLVNNLLQITQLEEGAIKLHKKPQSLAELIKKTLQRIAKKLANKPYQIKLHPELPQIPFDEVLLEQVFVNLIENAILYTPSDSPIEISAEMPNGNVLVSVADKGPGLQLSDIEMIFEKFYRGHNPRSGTGVGLGLAVCQSIVKAHGGRIWAENREGGGVIFYFALPLTSDEM